MYMHYLLGQGILAQPFNEHYQQLVADNTYVLALDGDVDFKPDALILLLDLMKRNSKVAAACGRIHPIGSGKRVSKLRVAQQCFTLCYQSIVLTVLSCERRSNFSLYSCPFATRQSTLLNPAEAERL